jgi:hypothetical protein
MLPALAAAAVVVSHLLLLSPAVELIVRGKAPSAAQCRTPELHLTDLHARRLLLPLRSIMCVGIRVKIGARHPDPVEKRGESAHKQNPPKALHDRHARMA